MGEASMSCGIVAPELVWDSELGGCLGRVRLRVRYAETDRMGVVYNAHYLTWFEVGRTEFMRSLGVPYRSMEEQGLALPLVDATLRFRRPIRYDDLVTVETAIDQLRSRTITFSYRILRDSDLVADGTTTHACVASSGGRVTHFPSWLREELRRAAGWTAPRTTSP